MDLKFNLPKHVQIIEVGPRDGLQNISKFIPTSKKIELINLLIKSGCKDIELTSFVHPKFVPQMQDAAEIVSNFKNTDINYRVLAPNIKGLNRAIECNVKEVVAFLSVSELHNMNNVHLTVEESIKELLQMISIANNSNTAMRVNIATAFGYENDKSVSNEKVIEISKILADAGFSSITLCDTTGIANPKLVYELCSRVIDTIKDVPLGVHFHKNNGLEYANIMSSLASGIKIFDSACGGIGGCPFAASATGNIATEGLVELFESMAINTGIDLSKINICSKLALELQKDYYKNDCTK